jgi:glycosyltransferase involved in cell wall biosynthesis
VYVLQNKTILLISPQSWGKMFVSKHHYAVELAKKGNSVYFLNPPGEMKSNKKISIEPSGAHENLFLVQHRLSFPYNLKFHFIGLFHALMKPHVKRIIKKIPGQIDIVWSFDLGNLYPFNFFPGNALKIFHPVDEPVNQTSIDSGNGAEVIFSVTNEILDKYKKYAAPKYLIRHGLASGFIMPVNVNRSQGNPVHVGLSGNLLRADIDREVLLKIVRENLEIIFECWGAYSMANSNIGGGEDTATLQFIGLLKKQPNIILHGTVSPDVLARAIHAMDAFLVCYDVKKDQSGGTNYHKIMEYLATGKIIISNNVSAYKDQPELVQMVEERDNNLKLPALFKKVVSNLDYFNNPSMQSKRISFAEDNTYSKQVTRIEEKIHG